MDKSELLNNLAQFSGTEGYIRHRYPGINLLLTDGVTFLAENAKCYWLVDVIASYQLYPKLKAENFQVWYIATEPSSEGVVWADDGNGNVLVRQEIPYTDFPLEDLKLYVIRQDASNMTVLLPGEY